MKLATRATFLFLFTTLLFCIKTNAKVLDSGENCRSERRLCSVRCEPSTTYVVNTTTPVPRLCDTSKETLDCTGNRCSDNPRICTRKRSERVPCKPGCSEQVVLTQECHSADECGDLVHGGCAARGEKVIYGSEHCEPCTNSFVNATLRSAISSSEETTVSRKWKLVLPFSDDKPSVRNLRCFAGFFREQECDGVSEVCSMTTRTFDSVLCLMKVCTQCARISMFRVSRELNRYCRYLTRETCRRVGGFGMQRFQTGALGMRNGNFGLVRESLTTDRNFVCVDGCRKRVLGCGERKSVCHDVGDECSMVTNERYVCDEGMNGVCGEDRVNDLAKVVVKKCQRKYCERRICE